MKRIAVISYHTCPLAHLEGKETGGMNVYVLEMGKQLARMGNQVDVFTRSQDEHNERVVEVEHGFRVVHVVAGPQRVVSKKELSPYLTEFAKGVEDFCSTESIHYDVWHAHYFLSGLIAQKLRLTHGHVHPLVVNFHTLALMKNLVARGAGELEDVERIEAETSISSEADRIIAPSDSDKQYLQFLYDVPVEKITIVPPGVDTDLFKPMDKALAKDTIKISHDIKLVLFVGRIEPLKGIDVLMYAMKILSKRNPAMRVCLAIVGGDVSSHPDSWSETLKSLDTLRRTLRLTASVNFLGQKTQEQLPYYYNAAEVVVMPSHYESFGMAALEAMACGVPVITTNVAGISSIIDEKHASLVTSVNNPLLLAKQIEELLSDVKKHDEIGESVRAQVMDLSWANVAKKLDRVYNEVILRRNI